MKIKNRFLRTLAALAVVVPLSSWAQGNATKPAQPSSLTVLTLPQALQLALANNYGIALQKLQVQQAKVNVHRGAAGQLPTINATVNRTYSNNTIRQEFGDPSREPIARSGAAVDALNGGLSLNWTLFDGMGMFLSYDRLQRLREQTDEVARATVEQTLGAVSTAFYSLLLQEQRLQLLQANANLSVEREALAKQRFEAGTGSKLDLLNAQVDRNTDQAAVMAQELQMEQALADLNVLMGRSPGTRFTPSGSLALGDTLLPEPLYKILQESSPQLAQARLQRSVTALDQRLAEADRMPTLNLVTGYNYNDQNFQAGLFKRNLSYGPTIGLSAGINIYNGGLVNRNVQLARINQLAAETNEAQVRLATEAAMFQALLNCNQHRRLWRLEQQNMAVAQQNVDIAMERYKVGLARAIELREAQRNLISAQSRQLEAAFRVKAAEVEVARLLGKASVSVVQ